MADLTRRERVVIISLTTAFIVGGAIFGFVAGGIGEWLFISILLCGTGAFLGASLPARSMAKSRQR
jgi:hypothetical protein